MPDNELLKIRLLCLDVDGVLTDGGITIDDQGVETKRFHVRDGAGLRLWMNLGNEAAIITARGGMAVQHRATELGIRHVMQNATNKPQAFGELLEDLGLAASEAAFIGDDLPDMPVMKLAGYPIAVADAVADIRDIAEFVTLRPGGHGAVREAVEHLLKGQERWDEALERFE